MKCFYHPQNDAAGVCRNCQKGICVECVTDLGNGIACKGKCEGEVSEVIAMVERGKVAYKKASESQFQAAIFWIIFGSVALVAGMISTNNQAFLFFGITFLVMAGWNLSAGFKNKKISKVSKS